MSAFAIALTTLVCVFGGALCGLYLQGVLPEHHLRADSKDVVKLVTGLIATLSALVLGLLIASAKTSFDAVNDSMRQGAARVILLDRLLAEYGPEAKALREQLRTTYAARIQQLFPDGRTAVRPSAALGDPSSAEGIQRQLRDLAPATDTQRAIRARAEKLVDDVAESRWLVFEQATGATPLAFLVVVVSWLALMFASFGLFAPRNGTTVAALLIGAMAVSTSLFLIEEMIRPLDGVIAIPSEPMKEALAELGK